MAATIALEDALKSDALETFARALEGVLAAPEHSTASCSHGSSSSRRTLLAVDASLHVIFQVLASGAGGKAFYDQLGVARLVKINVTAMNAHDVQERIVSGSDPVVFVVPPRPTTAKLVADSVRSLEGTRRCSVLWLPAASSECTLEIERQGVAGFVAQRDLSLGLVPIDCGVVALCRDTIFGELYVRGDHRALTDVVRSLLAIEQHTGAHILDVVCHGAFAERVRSMLQLAHALTPPSASQSQRRRSSAAGVGAGSDTAASGSSSPIDKLIVIDRMQDPLSMLLTPMTYEGLLDALLDVNHGVISYTGAESGSTSASSATDSSSSTGDATLPPHATAAQTTVILNHRDELFSDIRDVNINVLISHMLVDIAQDLVAQARLTGQTAAAASSTQSMSAAVLADTEAVQSNVPAATSLAHVTALLKRVPNLVKKKQSLVHHLHLVHQIRALSTEFELRGCVETEMAVLSASKSVVQDAERFLEEAVLRDPPLQLHDVLKLLCLCSLVRGGLKPESLLWYRRQLCHTYGYAAVLPLLVQLEKLELLSAASSTKVRKFDFASAKKKFALMRGALEDDDTLTPRDIHFMFPYTGYAPLSVRLVQDAVGIKYKSSALSGILPTSSKSAAAAASANSITSDTTSSVASASAASNDSVWSFASSANQQQQSSDARRVNVLVYYIGGVTVAELAAFRFLNQKQARYSFLVAATSVCNGSRLLRAIE